MSIVRKGLPRSRRKCVSISLRKAKNNKTSFTTSLFYSSTYLRRTVPYFYVLQKRVFCVKTRNSFLAHHGGRRLWPLPSPMARRHPNQTHRRHPHTMGDASCAWFGLNLPGGRVVSTPPPNAIMSFFLCMHVVDYFVEYIHIFDTLL